MKKKEGVLILTGWSFNDALVQTYTLPYLRIIRDVLNVENKIILVTSEQKRIAISSEDYFKINKDWQKDNIELYAQEYKNFGIKKIISFIGQFFQLIKLIRRNNVKIIHAFCTPAGGIGYLLSRFTGARLVIDSYEPHAEAMVENGTWKKSGLAYRILFLLEKWQTKRASALIATTAGMKEYAKSRYGASVKNFFVKPACVDLNMFTASDKDETLLNSLGLKEKIVCVYAGKLGGIYLNEEVFHFIKACYDFWGDGCRVLMLTNAEKSEIEKQMQRAGVPENILLSMFINHELVPTYLSLGDFAINPVKPVPTKKYCTSIKDGEYWAMGLPVVISPNISDDSFIIEKEGIGSVINFSDTADIKKGIEKIDGMLKNNTRGFLQNKIRQVAIRYRSYEIAKAIYPNIYG